jgi:hypothetical protein
MNMSFYKFFTLGGRNQRQSWWVNVFALRVTFFNGGKENCIGFIKAKQIWLAKKLYVQFQLPIDVLTSVFINNLPSFKCKKNHLHGANGPSIFLQVKHKNLPLESTHLPLNEIASSCGSLTHAFPHCKNLH